MPNVPDTAAYFHVAYIVATLVYVLYGVSLRRRVLRERERARPR